MFEYKGIEKLENPIHGFKYLLTYRCNKCNFHHYQMERDNYIDDIKDLKFDCDNCKDIKENEVKLVGVEEI